MVRWGKTGEIGKLVEFDVARLKSVTALRQQNETDETEWSKTASGHKKVRDALQSKTDRRDGRSAVPIQRT